MGFKKVLPRFHLINAGVMTGTATVTSNSVNIENLDNIGLQVSWTGTAHGTISVICSIDNVNYIALTFDPVLTQPAGASGSYLIDLNQVPFSFLKVSYTNASSTGVLDVWIVGKDVN